MAAGPPPDHEASLRRGARRVDLLHTGRWAGAGGGARADVGDPRWRSPRRRPPCAAARPREPRGHGPALLGSVAADLPPARARHRQPEAPPGGAATVGAA